MNKKRALVVCPGRGTYNKEELGYLHRRHEGSAHLWKVIDEYREEIGQPTITELDSAHRFSIKKHTLGEHASPLIYACSLADYEAIDKTEVEVVAITGNSMGWYTALALAQVLDSRSAIEVIDTMGSMMKKKIIGGQLIYPYVDEQWCEIPGGRAEILASVDAINQDKRSELYLSIDLGGYLVLAGNEKGMKHFERVVPSIQDRFPMRLYNHAAFHTPMLEPVSEQAFELLGETLFAKPEVPLVDGRGEIWTPYSSDVNALKSYTFGYQVYQPYDFSLAVEVAVKEYAPEQIIVLGPGTTLGSSVAQTLIKMGWNGLIDKESFKAQQSDDPRVVSMGMT